MSIDLQTSLGYIIMIDYDSFRTTTLRTFFGAFHAVAKELILLLLNNYCEQKRLFLYNLGKNLFFS